MPDPTTESTLKELKDQLGKIQGEIRRLEGSEEPVEGLPTREEPSPEGQRELEKRAENLMVWRAPSRVFRPRSKKWFINIGLMLAVISVVLLYMGELILIGAIIAVVFVVYVLATVPPEEVEHKITTQGIISGNQEYLWSELLDFWFSEKYGEPVLNIDVKVGFPGRLTMVYPADQKEKIKEFLSQYLPFRELPKSNWWEKATEGLVNRVPIEKSRSVAEPVSKEVLQ
jgi:hypothetical protein